MPFHYYAKLREQVDQWVSAATKRLGEHLVCRRKCDACCRKQFSVSSVEAYSIAEEFQTLSAETQRMVRQDKDSCPFLLEGECSIYPERPVICRTYGLPAMLPADQGGGVDWCELNIADTDPNFELAGEDVLGIETLNVKLAAINQLFLEETGSTGARIEMREIPDLDSGLLESFSQPGE
jgi:hypothetical protein